MPPCLSCGRPATATLSRPAFVTTPQARARKPRERLCGPGGDRMKAVMQDDQAAGSMVIRSDE